MARPTGRNRFTPELRQKILERLQAGATIKSTCESVGIGVSTYYEWVNIGAAHLNGDTHDRMPRNVVERQSLADFAEAVTRAIADSFVHATVAFRQGMNPSKTVATTSETVEETRVNPKTGKEYTYRKTTTRTTTTAAPGDWRAAMEYLARRDPEEWARTTPQKVEVNGTVNITYEDKAIALIREGKLDYPKALEVFDGRDELVQELFARANVAVQISRD
jgi:transposase-like protein